MTNRWLKRLRTPSTIQQYCLVTINYWAFTLTDGALRMLIVLYFHQLGYAPLQIALLFIFYELFSVITNLLGGWLGARLGLNRTMNLGLALQISALCMLAVSQDQLSVIWVISAQALSGVAKDLNKMSAKSAIKTLLPEEESSRLYRWVARLTGSKNTLKGLGFFLGGGLLAFVGFQLAIITLALALTAVWIASLLLLTQPLGKSNKKPLLRKLLSKSTEINTLSLARFFLFSARDVWFVIALPVYFSTQLNWTHNAIGGFMACWVIAYGLIQTQAPRITQHNGLPDGNVITKWSFVLSILTLVIAITFSTTANDTAVLVGGLMVFGVVFAINSSLHSFLVVQYANAEQVSLDVGYYYMANAAGRLIGTLLSGIVYQLFGLAICLFVSAFLLVCASFVSRKLPTDNYAIQK